MRGTRKRYRPLDSTEVKEVNVNQVVDVSLLEDEYSYQMSWPESTLTSLLRTAVLNEKASCADDITHNNSLKKRQTKNIELPEIHNVTATLCECNVDHYDLSELIQPFSEKCNQFLTIDTTSPYCKMIEIQHTFPKLSALQNMPCARREYSEDDDILSLNELQWNEVLEISEELIESLTTSSIKEYNLNKKEVEAQCELLQNSCYKEKEEENKYKSEGERKGENESEKNSLMKRYCIRCKDGQNVVNDKENKIENQERIIVAIRLVAERVIAEWERQIHKLALKFNNALTRLIPLAAAYPFNLQLIEQNMCDDNCKEETVNCEVLEVRIFKQLIKELNEWNDDNCLTFSKYIKWLRKLCKLLMKWRLAEPNVDELTKQNTVYSKNNQYAESDRIFDRCNLLPQVSKVICDKAEETKYAFNNISKMETDKNSIYRDSKRELGYNAKMTERRNNLISPCSRANMEDGSFRDRLWGHPLLISAILLDSKSDYFLNSNSSDTLRVGMSEGTIKRVFHNQQPSTENVHYKTLATSIKYAKMNNKRDASIDTRKRNLIEPLEREEYYSERRKHQTEEERWQMHSSQPAYHQCKGKESLTQKQLQKINDKTLSGKHENTLHNYQNSNSVSVTESNRNNLNTSTLPLTLPWQLKSNEQMLSDKRNTFNFVKVDNVRHATLYTNKDIERFVSKLLEKKYVKNNDMITYKPFNKMTSAKNNLLTMQQNLLTLDCNESAFTETSPSLISLDINAHETEECIMQRHGLKDLVDDIHD